MPWIIGKSELRIAHWADNLNFGNGISELKFKLANP